ncbi:MAG: phytanoyl-CoA dioxygenase family protein [Candidatus Rhabdochlamydia sp.]
MKFNCKKVIFLAFFIALSSLTLDAVETQGFLTTDDIALFYKQGYLLKSQCLSQEEMKQLNEDITTVIDRAIGEIQHSKDLTFSDDDQIIYINGSRVVYKRHLDQSIFIARINGCGGMQPALLATMRSKKMVRTFFELLGTNDLEHLISQIHPKLSGDGIAYPKHRDIQFRKSFDPDWQDVLGNSSYAICIIPIDRMTPENGGLWIDRNNYPEPQGLEEDLVWLYAEPGDLLFMHPHLYHGSGPNLAPNTNRKTLLTGFCAFGANHKPYPGAYVNTRFTLTEEGEISMSASPWNQGPSLGSGVGH